MKQLKYILLGILCTTFVSCEDFFETDAPSSFDSKYVFSTVSDAEKMVLGSYACFPPDAYTSRMSNVFMQNTDVEASAPSANPDGSRRDVWSLQGGLLENWSDIQTCWDNCYLAIDRANQCIEGIEASALYVAGDAEMKQLLGEAYCLRAYWYWMLCNYWGDVPLSLQASKAGMELNTPRVDKNIIYSSMIQSLVDIEEEMLFASQTKYRVERMNRDFALGFIAKLAMFRAGYGTLQDGSQKKADEYMQELPEVTYKNGGAEVTAKTSADYYQLAKVYAQKLIQLKDRPLNPDFKQIFLNQCHFVVPAEDDDILFEVAFVKNGGGDVGWCIGLTVDGGTFGGGGSYIFFPVTYYYSFDDNDLRLPVTCSLVKYETESRQGILGANGTVPAKWCRLWLKDSPGPSSSKGTGINWPILRYSDVLLLLAEAENELNGPSDLAKSTLKRVRNRAFAPEHRADKVESYVNGLSGKEAFFDAIVNERAWEFGGECIRKFDLIRWGIYGKKIVETKTKLTNMGKAANEQDLTNPEVAKYRDLAYTFYFTRTNGVIDIKNPRYFMDAPEVTVKPADVGDDGSNIATQDWTKSLLKKVTTKVDGVDVITWEEADFTVRAWRGYTDNTGTKPAPYLLPIPYQRIADSEGVLSNNGYGLVK